eukprot:TRINITY_DN36326_c0_g1_i2.p1 TRINITY_DN36326_c0_g1~~TRINITY_DN36326_c0_g1_i2.p1  ORF type:complete len:268 (+),score=92.67 TRINITY_DN36326_c0_g1_i2:174-977(+)
MCIRDRLMGEDRDGEAKAPKYKYWEPEVCQGFLEGICLHKVFNNTKLDTGPCPNVHDLKLRAEYLKAKRDGKDNFERNVRAELQRSIEECNRKIQRAVKRLEDEGTVDVMLKVTQHAGHPVVAEHCALIKAKLQEIQDTFLVENPLAEKDKRETLEEELEALRFKRASAESQCVIDTGFGDTIPKSAEVMELEKQISDKLSVAEKLGEEGDVDAMNAVSYTHLRAHETPEHLVCRLLLEKKKITTILMTKPMPDVSTRQTEKKPTTA